MQNMKNNIKRHIKNYYAECSNIIREYEQYETKEASNYYAPLFISQKINEKITKLKDARIELENKIDDELLFFIDNIKPNNTIINSIEYQSKLSNLFNLLNLEAELDESYLDFMIQANDFQTLELLKDKYKSKSLHIAFDKVDKEKVIGESRITVRLLKNYIDADKKFTMEESILKTLA